MPGVHDACEHAKQLLRAGVSLERQLGGAGWTYYSSVPPTLSAQDTTFTIGARDQWGQAEDLIVQSQGGFVTCEGIPWVTLENAKRNRIEAVDLQDIEKMIEAKFPLQHEQAASQSRPGGIAALDLLDPSSAKTPAYFARRWNATRRRMR
jgi:hypothetical protein